MGFKLHDTIYSDFYVHNSMYHKFTNVDILNFPKSFDMTEIWKLTTEIHNTSTAE